MCFAQRWLRHAIGRRRGRLPRARGCKPAAQLPRVCSITLLAFPTLNFEGRTMTQRISCHPDSRRRHRPRNRRLDTGRARRAGCALRLGPAGRRAGRCQGRWRPAAAGGAGQHPAHAPGAEGAAGNALRAAATARRTCACARNSSSTPTCVRHAPSCPAAASTRSTWWWCARTSKACTSATSTTCRSTTTRTRWPWPPASTPAPAAAGCWNSPSSMRWPPGARR